MKKKLCLILLMLYAFTILTGCYDSIEVNDQTYIIAIGLDKGKTTPLKVTLQYALANTMLSGGGEGNGVNGGNGKSTSSVTIETSTLVGGFDEINTFVAKKFNLSHAVILVISEELAREGVGRFIYGLNRNRQARPTMYIAVCRNSAEEFINSISPIQESDPSKYYQVIFSSSNYTGFFPTTEFFRFYSKIQSYSIQPAAALVAVNKYNSSDEFSRENSTYKKKEHPIPLEGDFKAGNIPRIGDVKGEIMGIAMFNGDKFIGELDGEDAMIYLMLTGEFQEAFFSLPDPKSQNSYISLNLKQSRKPKIKVNLESGKPQINVKIKLEADIAVIQSAHNYADLENLPILEDYAKAYIKKDIEYLLNETSSEYSCDVFGFGKEAKKNFLTEDEWIAYNWLDKYRDSSFKIDVDVKIRRPGLMLRTSPVKHLEE